MPHETAKPETFWALYCATTKHGVQGISLHATRRGALLSALDYIQTEREEETEDVEDIDRIEELLTDDDLADVVDAAAECTGDDWYIEEVSAPDPRMAANVAAIAAQILEN